MSIDASHYGSWRIYEDRRCQELLRQSRLFGLSGTVDLPVTSAAGIHFLRGARPSQQQYFKLSTLQVQSTRRWPIYAHVLLSKGCPDYVNL